MVPFLNPIGPVSFRRNSSRNVAQYTSDGMPYARNRSPPNDDPVSQGNPASALNDGDSHRDDVPPTGQHRETSQATVTFEAPAFSPV